MVEMPAFRRNVLDGHSSHHRAVGGRDENVRSCALEGDLEEAVIGGGEDTEIGLAVESRWKFLMACCALHRIILKQARSRVPQRRLVLPSLRLC